MNFFAMDFETANNHRSSACSIGIVAVQNNHIVKRIHHLIQPEETFNLRNIDIHHITPQMVKDALTFAELWPSLAPIFQPQHLVVAHNAPFDNSVLRATLEKYQLPMPRFLSIDTVKTSRELYPDLPNHRLDTVSHALDITLENHHNASADSEACAKILIKQQQMFGDDRLKPFVKVIK